MRLLNPILLVRLEAMLPAVPLAIPWAWLVEGSLVRSRLVRMALLLVMNKTAFRGRPLARPLLSFLMIKLAPDLTTKVLLLQ